MNQQICTAATAFPRLVDFLRLKLRELNAPPELDNLEKEIFYDSRTGDTYAAFTVAYHQDGRPMGETTFAAKVSIHGVTSSVSPRELALMDLEDITHFLTPIICQFLDNFEVNCAT